MAKIKIYSLLSCGKPTGYAVRSIEEAEDHREHAPGQSYIELELLPKKKKEKTEIERPLKLKYPIPYQILNEVKSLFPEDTVYNLTPKEGENWLKTINDLNRLDKNSFDLIKEVIIWWRNDKFWSDAKQSILCLRKKDGDSVQYFRKFKRLMENERRFTGTNKDRQIANSANDIASFIGENT